MADEVIIVDVVYEVDESEKAIDGLTGSVIELENANKSLRQDLKKSDDELKKENKSRKQLSTQLEKNSEALKGSKKERRELIKVQKLQSNSLDALKQKNKELIEQRNELDLSSKKGRKEFRKLNKSINQNNDTLKKAEQGGGNFGRSVGNYGDAISNTIPGVGALKGSVGSLFKLILTNPIGIILTALVALIQAFKRSQEGADTFAKTFQAVTNIVDVLIGRLARLGKIISRLIKGEVSFDEAKKEAAQAFQGIREEIEETVKESNRIFDLTKSLRQFNIEATTLLANLSKEAELQAAIADDATKSFQEREAAARKSEEAIIKQRNTELELARRNLEILQAENDLKEQQGLLTDELRQNEADSLAMVIEAEKNLALSRVEASKRRSELAQDNFEQELDFLLDVSDAQKTVNERRVADDKIALEERRKIIDETRELLNSSFDEQLELFERELGVQLERDKLLELNNKEIFEYARGLELSEIATNRLLEVIKERRFAIQDLADLERDIADEQAERESEREEKELEKLELELEQDESEIERAIEKQTALLDAEKERIEAIEEEERESLERRRATNAAFFDAVGQIVASAFAFQASLISKQEQDQLASAGENEEKREAIEKKFAKKRKNLALKEAIISGALAVLNALQTAPFIPLGLIAAALAAVATGFQIATIQNTQFGKGGQVPLMAGGGSIKHGTFVGAPHSSGGIDLFTGSGQHVANVEGKENFYVVNKNASDMINSLSAINQATGGVPLSKSSNFMQRGGQANTEEQEAQAQNISAIVAETVRQMPAPQVRVVDISTGISDRNDVRNVAVVS